MLINESIVTKHAEDAAFLWPQRDLAARSNHYTDRDLRRLDDRLAANLDGLLLAGQRGFAIALDELRAHGDEGEVFSAGVLALAAPSSLRLEPVLGAAFHRDDCARALVAAIAFHSFAQVEPLLRAWLSASSAFERYLGIAGYAVHRRMPPHSWRTLLSDASLRVARRAVQAVAELGCAEHLRALRARAHDPALDFAVCRVLAQRGAGDESVSETLFAHLSEPSHTYRAALALALAAPHALDAHVRACLNARNHAGAIALMEASGDVSFMPTLLRLMSDEACGQLAGEALRTITGVDLEQQDLSSSQREHEPRPERYLPHEARLARPSELAVARFWRAHESEFALGVRYLAGAPIADADGCQHTSLRELVWSGRPRQRQLAAAWLAAHAPSMPSINTRAFLTSQHVLPGWEAAESSARVGRRGKAARRG